MNGTERKRAWRVRNPEASRENERQRAQARRDGYWGQLTPGVAPLPCQSSESYARYEATMQRMKQRMFWPRYGAGTTTMTREEFRAASEALMPTAFLNGKRSSPR
jgi:hypothetical protein